QHRQTLEDRAAHRRHSGPDDGDAHSHRGADRVRSIVPDQHDSRGTGNGADAVLSLSLSSLDPAGKIMEALASTETSIPLEENPVIANTTLFTGRLWQTGVVATHDRTGRYEHMPGGGQPLSPLNHPGRSGSPPEGAEEMIR